jgi:glutamate dehydrogenase/leucine dehydrogenase
MLLLLLPLLLLLLPLLLLQAVIEAANAPTTLEGDNVLRERGIPVLPGEGWVTRKGVALSGLAAAAAAVKIVC